MSQLICRGVTLGYDKNIVARDLSFSVEKGDYICVVGENGAGKSTLLKAILSLNKPLSGSIETGDGLKSKEIGYLPQHTEVQRDFPATVYEIVMSGFLNRHSFRPFYTADEKAEGVRVMEKLGIEKLKKNCYRELSGGQQQRVLLARALCATSKMLVLDEPAAGLDPSAQEEMYSLIKALNREEGITVLMVTHDLSNALKDATHILYISKDKISFCTREEYLSRAEKGQGEK